MDGLLYYVAIDWTKLYAGKTWIDGATQIFFAYSVGMGALPALGSYNKFHHDCFRYQTSIIPILPLNQIVYVLNLQVPICSQLPLPVVQHVPYSIKIFLPRDAIITCIVNTMTCLLAGVLVFSILGYMAHVQETTIENVVNSGPGLVFLTYPDLVLKLPLSVMWAFIFFAMLLVR